jgi:glutaminyl-peptide cyclotransferase
MTNVVATIPGTAPSVVIICGHYYTKRMPTPFVGANDGGSSAAFLIKLAGVLARESHRLTYWVVFFDGEEALAHWSRTDGLYGSRHFVKRVAENGSRDQIKAVIVVDILAQMWPSCGPEDVEQTTAAEGLI